MADEKILITVDVDTEKMQQELSGAIHVVQAMKEEQKRLTKEITNGNDVNGEYARQLVQVSARLEQAQRQVKSQTAIMQAATAAGLKQNASLDEQRQYLGQLQKAYASLSGEAKEVADAEGGMRDQIKALNDSITDQEMAIGESGRMVGKYRQEIIAAAKNLGPMKGLLEGVAGGSTTMSKALDGTDKVMKGMMANPFFGTVFLLGGILGLIGDKLKENEEALNGVHTVTAGIGGTLKALQPMLDWVVKFLVDNLLKALEWVMDAIKNVLSWVDKIARKFGKELNLSLAFEEGTHAARELTEEEKRAAEEAVKAEAEKVRKIAALREELKKRRMDDQERELYELQKRAEEELKTAKLTAEEKAEIQAYYEQKADEVRKKYADEEAKRAAEEAKRAEEEAAKVAKAEAKKLEARQKAREQFGLDPEKSPEEKELEALQIAREADLINAEEYELAKTMIAEKYSQKRQEDIDAEVKKATALYEQSVKGASSATAGALSALSNLLGEYAESSEEAAKAQKAFALGSIIINQAMSVAEGAKGIAAAMAGAAEAAAATGPAAPFTLIAFQAQMVGQVLAVVASVASTIVQAKQLFSQANNAGSYEHGGIIPGTSYTGDKLTANVNSREGIFTLKQQQRLFDIANGDSPAGFAYEQMARAIAEGMAAAPAPRLALDELADAQERITNYDEIAAV